ncbi:MAG TPA: hypothetical protein VFJ74_04370, partial [Gemmatimonadaceae bacterium]|nr:hypothetical protein [Gemmatimonadaceae bacterium]
PGVLLSSGLIAGGAITGIALAALAARDLTGGIDMEKSLGAFAASPLVAFIAFLVLVATPLYLTARKGGEVR